MMITSYFKGPPFHLLLDDLHLFPLDEIPGAQQLAVRPRISSVSWPVASSRANAVIWRAYASNPHRSEKRLLNVPLAFRTLRTAIHLSNIGYIFLIKALPPAR